MFLSNRILRVRRRRPRKNPSGQGANAGMCSGQLRAGLPRNGRNHGIPSDIRDRSASRSARPAPGHGRYAARDRLWRTRSAGLNGNTLQCENRPGSGARTAWAQGSMPGWQATVGVSEPARTWPLPVMRWFRCGWPRVSVYAWLQSGYTAAQRKGLAATFIASKPRSGLVALHGLEPRTCGL